MNGPRRAERRAWKLGRYDGLRVADGRHPTNHGKVADENLRHYYDGFNVGLRDGKPRPPESPFDRMLEGLELVLRLGDRLFDLGDKLLDGAFGLADHGADWVRDTLSEPKDPGPWASPAEADAYRLAVGETACVVRGWRNLVHVPGSWLAHSDAWRFWRLVPTRRSVQRLALRTLLAWEAEAVRALPDAGRVPRP